MKIFIWKRYKWRKMGNKWFDVHTNRCFCPMRGCRKAKKGKDYKQGWVVCIGGTAIRIDRHKPKGCTAPF